MAGISARFYGSGKFGRARCLRESWHSTPPSIKPVIMALLILNIGNLINIGFEKQMLLGNNIVAEKALVLDLYALNYGIGMFRYSFGTAIGIFKSVISIIVIVIFNNLAKKTGDGGIY